MAIEFADVARLLSCREFAAAEGMKMRGGRAVCPFHAGADGYNLAFYERDGRCHCFKCGATADVVQLAAAVWSCSQVEAAGELNRRYNLRLDGRTPTAAEVEAWQRKRRQHDDKQQAAEAAVEAAEAEARAARAAVTMATSTADRDELQRRARNADTWLNFKRVELSIARGERE